MSRKAGQKLKGGKHENKSSITDFTLARRDTTVLEHHGAYNNDWYFDSGEGRGIPSREKMNVLLILP